MLFVGDDWAEDHHDIEVQDEADRVLARAKLPEGVAGIARLHAMIGERLGDDDEADVAVGIETDRAGDTPDAEAVKVVTRAHKTLIWERTRHLLRLRHALREFFPAALVAFDDLTAVDALELLAAAVDPSSAAALSIDTIEAALKRARRHHRAAKAQAIAAALRAEHLGQPASWRRRTPPACA